MRVLLAIDGSDESMAAVAAVEALRMPAGSLVEIVRVIPETGIFGDPTPAITLIESPGERARVWHESRERLEQIGERLESPNRSVSVTLLVGRPASQIVLEASRAKADVIVMGARGLTATERILLGSVSSEVVDHAPCPVLVARRGAVERVMLATDGAPAAAAAADFIAGSGLFDDAQVHIVSVADAGTPWWTGLSPVDGATSIDIYADALRLAGHHASEASEAAVRRLRGMRVTSVSARPDRDVVSAILAEADDWRPDIIVVGARNLGVVHRWLVGSVSRSILHLARMSVLVVRPKMAVSSRSEEATAPAA